MANLTLDAALHALESAVTQLEAAHARRKHRDAQVGDVEAELQLMRSDRSRLADELDAAVARGNALDAARTDVANRLERAIHTIRNTLGKA